MTLLCDPERCVCRGLLAQGFVPGISAPEGLWVQPGLEGIAAIPSGKNLKKNLQTLISLSEVAQR